jgi:hypothetical protein
MANAVIKRGFLPVGTIGGSPYTGAVRPYSVAAANATAIFIGDLVTASTTSQTINGVVYQDVVQSATGDVFQGVVVGVDPVTNASLPYRAASTQRVVFVADDPNLMLLTDDISTGTPLAAADVGLNANIVVGTGSTVTGYSAMELDNTTEATTNTLDVKIMGILQSPDNDPASASARFVVKLNRHRFANQVAGI